MEQLFYQIIESNILLNSEIVPKCIIFYTPKPIQNSVVIRYKNSAAS